MNSRATEDAALYFDILLSGLSQNELRAIYVYAAVDPWPDIIPLKTAVEKHGVLGSLAKARRLDFVDASKFRWSPSAFSARLG